MSDNSEKAKPIVIKRIKKSGHGHHGGSWKVAFADFATAMMAFFLLLWLMGNTSKDEKEAISGYFNDPSGQQMKTGSSPSVIGDGGANVSIIEFENVKPESSDINVDESIESEALENEKLNDENIAKLAEENEVAKLNILKQELENLVQNSEIFSQFKEQVIIDITPAGLRIQIVDKDKRPMFDSGSAVLKYYSKTLLQGLAGVLKQVPNKISITGHTDATPYIEREDYGNWELSSDRANSARRELQQGGVLENKIARVEGFSSSLLFDVKHPHNPINRRIAIIVLKQSAVDDIENQVRGIK